jgi:two-component system C4-dicarboxylate transport sensor histidine kinase DctB
MIKIGFLVPRIVIFLIIFIFLLIIWFSNFWLTEKFTQSIRASSELKAALYSNAIDSELKKNQVIPFLVSMDPMIMTALRSNDYETTSERLSGILREIGASKLRLLDYKGLVVASSDKSELGRNLGDSLAFVSTNKTTKTIFKINKLDNGFFQFTYSRLIFEGQDYVGAVIVDVNLLQFERKWKSPAEAILIINSSDEIVMTTENKWRGMNIGDALRAEAPTSVLNRAFHVAGDYFELNSSKYFVNGQAVMRTDMAIPFEGLRLSLFSNYASVRERVNAVIAIEIMFFSLLATLVFYYLNRRANSEAFYFKKESEELRALNLLLNQEVVIRKKTEKNLEVAEQSLVQSQKLAVLGEMSAAVSHELNQPLAAMKTYLAAAKLLFDRRRSSEGLASLQRIDDLIERMSVITRQLKSHATKMGDLVDRVGLKDVIANSLLIMEPNLNLNSVEIDLALSEPEVYVIGNKTKLEQVVINMVQNALDALTGVSNPKILITLGAYETAILRVSDNGSGIKDLEKLFEPFFTTKSPGDGLGLGLAISSSIINNYGGRMTARNNEEKGAIFEIFLPLAG